MFIQHSAFDFEYILFSDYINCSAGLSRVKRQKNITNQSKCRELLPRHTHVISGDNKGGLRLRAGNCL